MKRIGQITDVHINSYGYKKERFKNFLKNFMPKVDILTSTGDWSSLNVTDLEIVFKLIREETDKEVYSTLGNHDYYCDTYDKTMDEVIEYQKELFKKYNIIHLENNFVEYDTFTLCGYDGWYAREPRHTKDAEYIPKANSLGGTYHQFMQKKEALALDKVLAYDLPKNKTNICITHFGFHADKEFENHNANQYNLRELSEKFDVLFTGHSHRKLDVMVGKCRVLNVGASYEDSPENWNGIYEF